MITYATVAVSELAAPMSIYMCSPLLAPHIVGITCPVFVYKRTIRNKATLNVGCVALTFQILHFKM